MTAAKPYTMGDLADMEFDPREWLKFQEEERDLAGRLRATVEALAAKEAEVEQVRDEVIMARNHADEWERRADGYGAMCAEQTARAEAAEARVKELETEQLRSDRHTIEVARKLEAAEAQVKTLTEERDAARASAERRLLAADLERTEARETILATRREADEAQGAAELLVAAVEGCQAEEDRLRAQVERLRELVYEVICWNNKLQKRSMGEMMDALAVAYRETVLANTSEPASEECTGACQSGKCPYEPKCAPSEPAPCASCVRLPTIQRLRFAWWKGRDSSGMPIVEASEKCETDIASIAAASEEPR